MVGFHGRIWSFLWRLSNINVGEISFFKDNGDGGDDEGKEKDQEKEEEENKYWT